MFKIGALLSLTVLMQFAIQTKAACGQMGSRDYLPFAMIDGYYRQNYTETRFDAEDFPSDTSGKKEHVEGHKYDITCLPTNSGPHVSLLEVTRTFEMEAKTPKWGLAYDGLGTGTSDSITARSDRNGSYVWVKVAVCCGGSGIDVSAIAERPSHISIAPKQ